MASIAALEARNLAQVLFPSPVSFLHWVALMSGSTIRLAAPLVPSSPASSHRIHVSAPIPWSKGFIRCQRAMSLHGRIGS